LPLYSTKTNLAALLAALAGLPVSSSQAIAAETPACVAIKLPAEWAGWATPKAAPADGALMPGKAYIVTLSPMADVPITAFDGKELPEGSRGAVFNLVIRQAGTYRVTVGDPMWIDLIGPEGVVESTAHAHGPDCSGLGKMVDFPLKQGAYRLELSAAEVPTSAVMAIDPTD